MDLVGRTFWIVNLEHDARLNGTAVHVEQFVGSQNRFRCTYTDRFRDRKVVGVKRLNLADSDPAVRHGPGVRGRLTPDEQIRLLLCGRRGEVAGERAWALLAHSIKFKHGTGTRARGFDDYPDDWHQMVNVGELYGLAPVPAAQTRWTEDRLRAAAQGNEWPGEPPSSMLGDDSDDDEPRERPGVGGDGLRAALDGDHDYFDTMERLEEKKKECRAFAMLTWPSYEDAKTFISRLAVADALAYDEDVHTALKQLWESKHSVGLIKDVGRFLANKGGLDMMRTTWYSYQKVQLCMCRNKGWCDRGAADTWHLLKLDLNKHWDGIGGWCN